MSDHEKFKALLEKVGLNYAKLAEILEMSPSSVKNQLAPGKGELPRWAKAMLYVSQKL